MNIPQAYKLTYILEGTTHTLIGSSEGKVLEIARMMNLTYYVVEEL